MPKNVSNGPENARWITNLGSRLIDVFREALLDAGWKIKSIPTNGEGDFLVTRDSLAYAVELKASPEVRRPTLEGMLASAILRAQAAAKRHRVRPLAIVGAPRLSLKLLEELGEFAHRYGRGVAWAAVDAEGFIFCEGDGLKGLQRERRFVESQLLPPPAFDPFSDRGQWLLKLLLSNRLPEHLRTRTLDQQIRSKPFASAAELAAAAKVSPSWVSKFLSSLKHDGFLSNARFEVQREEELLRRWRAVTLAKRPVEIPARWVLPTRNGMARLQSALRAHAQRNQHRACLGIFAACEQMGFDFVRGVAPHLYVDHARYAVEEFGLYPTGSGESVDVFLREPRFPESIFRAAAMHDGVATADIIQCWLDAGTHPARGDELSNYLYDSIIRKHIVRS